MLQRIENLETKINNMQVTGGEIAVTEDHIELVIHGGTGGTTEYFADILSGSGLTYTCDIYNEFASDMTFTAITAYEEDATVKVPAGMLDADFDLTAGQVYMVAQYTVDGESAWVMTTRAGVS